MISFMFYCLFVKHFIKMLCYIDPSQFEIQISWVVSIAERSFWTDHARLLHQVITTDDIVTFSVNRFVALMKLLIFAQYSLLLTIFLIFSDFEQTWKNTFLQKVRFFIYNFFIFKKYVFIFMFVFIFMNYISQDWQIVYALNLIVVKKFNVANY